MQKLCTKCRLPFDLNDLPKRSTGKIYGPCKTCKKLISKNHYKNNKGSYKSRARVAKLKYNQIINELKKKPCRDCNKEYNYWVMHFDHLDPKTKVDCVSSMKKRQLNLKAVLEETQKCDVVCANCHAERTHQRANQVI